MKVNPNEQKLLDSISRVISWSDSLDDRDIYLDKKWVEIDLDGGETQSIQHIFKEDDVYIFSLNGNIVKGFWQTIDGDTSVIIEQYDTESNNRQSYLFDLLFLNKQFMVLKKNGKNIPFDKRYLFLTRDNWEDPLTFDEGIEELRHIKSSSNILYLIGIIIVLAVLALLYLKS